MKFRIQSLMLCAVLCAATASAQTVSVQPPEENANDTVTTTVNGQQVKVNRQTGRLVAPTAEEAKILAEGMKNLLNRSTEGLTVHKHADGTEETDLQGRFMNLMLARTTTDGKVETECVTTPESAADFFGFKLDPATKDTAPAVIPPAAQTPPPTSKPVTKTRSTRPTRN
ncbi:MAG: hypothetical protein MSG64_02385 [Pyrinomonadaceae bacterium MAG19_C2-C3]|nr:hypothetical protein [Pyrinomonadaceae bacterium MAG19_C2-C3]